MRAQVVRVLVGEGWEACCGFFFGLYLETFLGRDGILRLLSSSLTLQSQVTVRVFHGEICSH